MDQFQHVAKVTMIQENSLMPQKNCNRKVIGAKWFIDGFLAESLLVLSSSS